MPRNRTAHAEYMREYWYNNPDKYEAKKALQYAQKRDPKHWARVRLSVVKCRAKKQGLDFNLDEGDLELPEVCPVLGIPLILGAAATHPASPQVDRIDSSLGYIKGNVRVISGRANYLKRDATFEELKALVSYMEN